MNALVCVCVYISHPEGRRRAGNQFCCCVCVCDVLIAKFSPDVLHIIPRTARVCICIYMSIFVYVCVKRTVGEGGQTRAAENAYVTSMRIIIVQGDFFKRLPV